MNKGRFLALAATQVMLFILVLTLWHDRTAKDMIHSTLIPGYAIVQLFIHWGLWEPKSCKLPKKEEKS